MRGNTIRGGGACKNLWDYLYMIIKIILYVFSIYEFEPTAMFSIYIQLGQGFEC